MMKNKFSITFTKSFGLLVLIVGMAFSAQPALAQTAEDNDKIKQLRSDVGINGIKANLHWLNDLTYLGNDTLRYDGSSELEFVFRNVRMMSPRIGVGFQVLTSFFVNGPESDFGVGSWGLGPVVRAYPFKTATFQPYAEMELLFGNNMGLGTLANTREAADGFRVRFGLRGGIAYRLTNGFGIFIEGGPDWESPRIFRSDARAWQINFGVDVYRFK